MGNLAPQMSRGQRRTVQRWGGARKPESLILLTMATLGLERSRSGPSLVRVRILRKCPELPQDDTLRGHRGTPQALPLQRSALLPSAAQVVGAPAVPHSSRVHSSTASHHLTPETGKEGSALGVTLPQILTQVHKAHDHVRVVEESAVLRAGQWGRTAAGPWSQKALSVQGVCSAGGRLSALE